MKLKSLIHHNALEQLPAVFPDATRRILLVADQNTDQVAGRTVSAILRKHGYQCQECILRRETALVADETALAEIKAADNPASDLYLAVGSGTITDLTRFASFNAGKPFVAVPTAPSMDGYASPVAALTLHGFKQTLPAAPPLAIVGDPELIATAPPLMIAAGLGDLVGKYTALADWKLGQIINAEPFAPELETMVRSAVDQAVQSFEADYDPVTRAKLLTEALIISGEAMLTWGNSRPASGAEHHLAHFWEMTALRHGHPAQLHGIKVGVATLLVLEHYRKLFQLNRAELQPLLDKFRPETETAYLTRIKAAYDELAQAVLDDLQGCYRTPETRQQRQANIVANWSGLQQWVNSTMPTVERVRAILAKAGAPITAEAIGIGRSELATALQNAKEVRVRYTVFRLAEDLGITGL